VQAALAYAENIIATVREPFLVLDRDLRVVTANRSFYENFHVTPEETQGCFIYDLGNRQWDIPRLRLLLEEILPQDRQFHDFQVEYNSPAIGRKTMLLNARRIREPGNQSELILLAIEDITERNQAKSPCGPPRSGIGGCSRRPETASLSSTPTPAKSPRSTRS